MRNERRMSGSARGDEKPTAAKRYGAHRLLNPKNRMRNLDRFSSWLSLADLRLVSCAQSSCNGFADRCSDETAYGTGSESVTRALEVLVNQYDWLPGPLTFQVVKRLKFSTVGIVGITLG